MRIGLALGWLSGFDEALVQGIAAYARPKRPWTFDRCYSTREQLAQLVARRPDGILLGSSDPVLLTWISKSKIPIVNLHPCPTRLLMSFVSSDDVAVGRMAAAHFVNRGYVHFAFFGRQDGEIRDERLAGFRSEVKAFGQSCSFFDGKKLHSAFADCKAESLLAEWLRSLPKPVGIFSPSDEDAWIVVDRGKRLGLRVPEDVAVLGADNDAVTCVFGNPALSSVQTAGRKIGYEGSRILEELIDGTSRRRVTLRVPPVRVVTRQSTNSMGTRDELTQRALEYMRAHLSETHGIDELIQHLDCSRRMLERRFEATTLLAPANAWLRFRAEEAVRLLAEDEVPLPLVGEMCGLNTPKIFSKAVRAATGFTPLRFRRHAAP